jgi:hypothetical protein
VLSCDAYASGFSWFPAHVVDVVAVASAMDVPAVQRCQHDNETSWASMLIAHVILAQ